MIETIAHILGHTAPCRKAHLGATQAGSGHGKRSTEDASAFHETFAKSSQKGRERVKIFKPVKLMSFVTIAAMAAIVPSAAPRAGIIVGNGGDPLPILFKDAQQRVVADLRSLDTRFLPPETSPGVRTFLESNAARLADDIAASRHRLSPEGRSDHKCAWTNVDPSPSDIHFFLPGCAQSVRDARDAMALLVHEAVHHFGVGADGEDFCDEVGLAVVKGALAQKNSARPFTRTLAPTADIAPRAEMRGVWTGFLDENQNSHALFMFGGCGAPDATLACKEYASSGLLYLASSDTWKSLPKQGEPSPRREHAVSWSRYTADSKRDLIAFVWGGCTGPACGTTLGDGALFDLKSNSWSPVPSAPEQISPRASHHMAWGGTAFVIWGGEENAGNPNAARLVNTGASYDPVTRTWTPLPVNSAPEGRIEATFSPIEQRSESTGTRREGLLVWGGCADARRLMSKCARPLDSGAIFWLDSRTWEALPADGAPSPRHAHSAVWTGSQLIVWGGKDLRGELDDGAVFDLASRSWRPLPYPGPSARAGHTAVWTGTHMIVASGSRLEADRTVMPADLGILTLDALHSEGGAWKIETSAGLQRDKHLGVWTGEALLLWGGRAPTGRFTKQGFTYHPTL